MVVRKPEPSTAAAGAGTPWQGRLRPHHAGPLGSPTPWVPFRFRTRDADEDARRFKTPGRRRDEEEGDGAVRRSARVIKRRSPRCPCQDHPEHPIGLDEDGDARRFETPGSRRRDEDEGDGAVRRSRRVIRRRSPRCPCQDHPDHPIGLDEGCKVRGNQSAVMKSVRFQLGDKSQSKLSAEKGSHRKQQLPPWTPNPRGIAHNKETQNAVKEAKERENPTTRGRQRNAAVKSSARMKENMELQTVYEDSQDVPARKKAARAPYKKSEMQEPKPSCCEEPSRKRKRYTAKKPTTSRKQSHPEAKSDFQEIAEPGNIIRKKAGNDPSSIVQPKTSDDTQMNTKECKEELNGIEGVQQQLCASDDWTEEQDLTLRQAYFTARPSPHFWKKVSKMVPGKSAEECFNRVHADLSTPAPVAPRPRTSKIQFSPLGKFTLSDSKFPNLLEPLPGTRKTAKQTSLAAQKMVKHLLKKHSLIDQAQEADHFSIFETSPSALQLNIPLGYSPGTPDSYINSCSILKYSVSSSARKRPLARLKTKQAELSPAVLKPVKNAILHEKYINQLTRREVAKKPRKKAANTKATDPERPILEQQAGVVKAAKNALITEATDFICQFKKLQANSLAHVLENSEDDAENCIASY